VGDLAKLTPGQVPHCRNYRHAARSSGKQRGRSPSAREPRPPPLPSETGTVQAYTLAPVTFANAPKSCEEVFEGMTPEEIAKVPYRHTHLQPMKQELLEKDQAAARKFSSFLGSAS
jgi:hypothetical protein